MKRTVSAAFLLFFVALPTLVAADPARYVVMMRRTAAVRPTALMRDAIPTERDRDVREFRIINAFAATLTDDEVAALRRHNDVSYVEPVATRTILGSAMTAASDETRNLNGQTVPSGIDAVRARDVWPYTRGKNVNIAIIDTGIDYTHPDLSGAYAGGYNAVTRSSDPRDDNGHGSHVAGTIGAADNNIGVVGVAPAVRIWSVKALRGDGTGTTDSIIAGLDWVVSKKAEVGGNWIINLSLGSSERNNAEETAVERTIDAGVLIIAASGNASTAGRPKPVSFPAAYARVVAVGAIDTNGAIATFSNQGPELAVVAPGVDVLSTVPVGSVEISLVRAADTTFGSKALTGSAKGSVTGAFVNCGIGRPEDFPASVAGKIAVIERGGGTPRMSFAEKTRNAKAAGAAAVLIYSDDDTPSINWTLISASNDPSSVTFDWPVTIGVTRQDGLSVLANPRATLTVANTTDDYDIYNGTSMASPHVVGVAALAWSLAPSASVENIASALTLTAKDLGDKGRDNAFGSGEVDALNAARYVAPAVFSSPAQPAEPPVPSGRRNLKRGH